MKQFLKQVLAYSLVLSTLAGCSQGGETASTTGEVTSSRSLAQGESQSQGRLQIITSTFAEYCWVQEILGERSEAVDVKLLLDGGMDMHSYAPSVDDMITIGSADLFLHIGGESFTWVDSVLDNASNGDLRVLNLMESLGDGVLMERSEGIATGDDCCEEDHDHDHDECEDEDCDHDHDHDEGEDCDHDHDHDECEDEDCDHDHDHDECEDEDCDHDHDHDECEDEDCDHDHDHDECEDEDCDHDHDHDECEDEDCDHDHTEECEEHGEDCDHDHSHEDEHLWMSLRNAQTICTLIAEALVEIDPDYQEVYEENLNVYLKKLQDLDTAYVDMIASAQRDVFVVADRFPFLYLVEDYGLEHYAAFSGCSAETEASFETIIFLAGQVDAHDLSCVVTTETGNAIAKTVVSSTETKDQDIFVLNSIQSTTSQDGVTYLELMEDNLAVLTEVLDG